MNKDKIINKIIDGATTIHQLKDAFYEVYLGYINYKISLDSFSYYSGEIFSKLVNFEKSQDKDELQTAVLAGSELDWYLRQPDLFEKTKSFLDTVHSYGQRIIVEKNK